VKIGGEKVSNMFGKPDVNDELAKRLGNSQAVNSAMQDLDKEALKQQNNPDAYDGTRPSNIIFNVPNSDLNQKKE
jgi:hypothetical protein